jgi:hypothetical protein
MHQPGLTSSTNNCAVGPSGILVGPSYQQALTKNQQALTTSHPSQNQVNVIQNSNPILSEQGRQATRELDILAATGKTKD